MHLSFTPEPSESSVEGIRADQFDAMLRQVKEQGDALVRIEFDLGKIQGINSSHINDLIQLKNRATGEVAVVLKNVNDLDRQKLTHLNLMGKVFEEEETEKEE